jgi:hypothetical protein
MRPRSTPARTAWYLTRVTKTPPIWGAVSVELPLILPAEGAFESGYPPRASRSSSTPTPIIHADSKTTTAVIP